MNNELYHYGVKGMKWGVRKDGYRSHGVRAVIARKSNKRVDKGFKKWKKNSDLRDDAIAKGKVANEKRVTYETNKTKENKTAYKTANAEYKKALNKNTSYRKGVIRQEVGRDSARKYMSAAKKAKKQGLEKEYARLMSKHDIERAKARRAASVGQRRSQRKAAFKRGLTISAKTAVSTAVITGGATYVNSRMNGNININSQDVKNAINKFRKFYGYIY